MGGNVHLVHCSVKESRVRQLRFIKKRAREKYPLSAGAYTGWVVVEVMKGGGEGVRRKLQSTALTSSFRFGGHQESSRKGIAYNPLCLVEIVY